LRATRLTVSIACKTENPMDTIAADPFAAAEEFITLHPASTDAAILGELLVALREDGAFDVQKVYELNLTHFDVAVEMLKEWRLQRYYRGHAVVAAAFLGQ
jgi:hypothetical protein